MGVDCGGEVVERGVRVHAAEHEEVLHDAAARAEAADGLLVPVAGLPDRLEEELVAVHAGSVAVDLGEARALVRGLPELVGELEGREHGAVLDAHGVRLLGLLEGVGVRDDEAAVVLDPATHVVAHVHLSPDRKSSLRYDR